jgi:hypothetical protein
MGEAYTAVCDDVTSVYWNPAGLSNVNSLQLHLMHSDAITDASLNFAGVAYPWKKYGILSVSAIFYSIKPIPVTLQNGTSLGDLTWNDTALLLSYGKRISNNLAFGIGTKFIKRLESDPIFGSSEGTTYAFDCGLLISNLLPGLNAGASVVNTGSDIQMSGEVKKDVLPQTVRMGLAYKHKIDKDITFTFAHDFNRILSSSWYFGSGLELDFQNIVAFRTGFYKKEGSIEGVTYGFGVKLKQLQIDYSNVPASEMEGFTRNNKLSLSFLFP